MGGCPHEKDPILKDFEDQYAKSKIFDAEGTARVVVECIFEQLRKHELEIRFDVVCGRLTVHVNPRS